VTCSTWRRNEIFRTKSIEICESSWKYRIANKILFFFCAQPVKIKLAMNEWLITLLVSNCAKLRQQQVLGRFATSHELISFCWSENCHANVGKWTIDSNICSCLQLKPIKHVLIVNVKVVGRLKSNKIMFSLAACCLRELV
jgi:hypothetical protein